MHRFRKKSETRRSGQVPFSVSSDTLDEQDTSPQIPLPNDFRTSLILPDLSRRFSLLRSPTGEPVGLDVLRSRIAEQRARGAENHISEDEEEMILNTLRGLRSKTGSSAQRSEESVAAPDTDGSIRQSSSTLELSPAASVTSSPGNRSTKRYSNNLFGSGRFRDYTYMRSATKAGSTRTNSLTPTEASYRGTLSSIVDSLRPVTPEGSGFSSVQSSPNDKASAIRSTPLVPPAPYGEQNMSVAEYRLSKTLGPSALKRASMALEQVIKEIEEEAEDEIVMPRSTPIPRPSLEPTQSAEAVRTSALSQSSVYEAGMAISSDKQVQDDPEFSERRASPIPSQILPGYIPGMPRPMTPRDFDSDDLRSHSTTPRATSPNVANFADTSVSSIPTNANPGRLRSNSAASQSAPRSSTSPLFLQRSPNGRFTPEDNNRENNSLDFENPLNPSILTRRRPASPLSGASYQPLAVSSRPSTPSNIVWATNSRSSNWPSGHNRNESWNSDGAVSSSDVHGAMDGFPATRILRSPALPDSPTIEAELSNMSSFSPVSDGRDNPVAENRPGSKMSLVELGSPMQSPRSLTPTQSGPRSPASSTFADASMSSKSGGKRSSKQNTPSNLFNLGPIPPLVFSPLANSSRSSLESAGSSYHSEEKDYTLSLFTDDEVPKPVWHDLSVSEKSSSATPGDSPEDDWDPEEIVAQYAGLKKSDFLAIQEKLVNASITMNKEEKPAERAASAMRRRRPSTSQSSYSTNGREHRIASPPPQIQPPSSPTLVSNNNSSLNAASSPPSSPKERDISPITRRNRDLAQALFGREEAERRENNSKSGSSDQTISAEQLSRSAPTNNAAQDSLLSPSSPTPYQLSRNPSMPRIPQTPQEEAQLAREVQQRMTAATLALKKSPNRSPDLFATVSRKRISPNQISTPHLISASTSVDAVPIVRTPSLSSGHNTGPSKIGSRFKKLRGTLRAKNNLPTGEEVTPYPLDLHSPSAGQTAHYNLPRGGAVAASATETRFKVPVPSPPASAGPGLKGFMARFRGKQRPTADMSPESERRQSPHPPAQSLASSQSERVFTRPLLTPQARDVAPDLATPRPETPQAQSAPPSQTSYADSPPSEPSDALRQFFEAANRIGLDQGDLNAFLARSGSTSSRTTEWTMLTRNNSAVRPGTDTPADPSRLTPSIGRPSIDDQSMLAVTPDPIANERGLGRPSLDGQAPRDKPVSRQLSRKQPDHLRRPREGQGGDSRAASAVIRRTIIFPDSKMSANELAALMRKNSSRRKRASATSVSGRSIHDRAPTPPPPRSPTSKRFSNAPSPPVPSLPAAVTDTLTVPSASTGGPIEKSNSTYDSLYDMYAGESRSPSATPNEAENSQSPGDSAPESGAAVELVQLANGETIWSIVNGLRDDDEESTYTGRASFTSEYSAGDGGLQVFVKEHGRSGSKGSTSSFISRKRTGPGKQRPETKVFYSPSANIGRLIEDISQGMDAGSFNFLPTRPPGHSTSSSLSTNDMTWSIEDRLEEMISTVRAS
ncbi:hypothetical protein Hypma_008730 [Hypsizygus marmoreus]|uniref:Uncharacterized protein n=1 Tax=Hypsizygus marmoreus TaxID=39966 RepID=A0A369JPV6_HYPMA|nr:hypothetical protein Hypma_008730 [Hypsizygus marmoreus]